MTCRWLTPRRRTYQGRLDLEVVGEQGRQVMPMPDLAALGDFAMTAARNARRLLPRDKRGAADGVAAITPSGRSRIRRLK
jgi:hypothetical protein